MGRARKPLRMQQIASAWACYMKHPLTRRVKYVPLGTSAPAAEKLLAHLNAVFMNPERSNDLPADFPIELREVWLGDEAKIFTDGKRVKQGRENVPVDADELAAARAGSSHLPAVSGRLRLHPQSQGR